MTNKIIVGVNYGSYSFNAVTKEVTLSGITTVSMEQLLLIVNVTTNDIIYSPVKQGLGATLSGFVYTLEYDTTLMNNSDDLQIHFSLDGINDSLVQEVSGTVTVDTSLISTEATLLDVKSNTDNLDVALSTRLNTLGQKAMADSSPVVIASNQSPVPVSGIVTATVDTSLLATSVKQDLLLTELQQKADLTETQPVSVVYKKEALDLFGLLQTGTPQSLFDAQFTYGLQPLLYSARNNGGTVAHSTTERCAVFTGAANATPYMQSYEYIRYQPAKMQKIFLTGNFRGGETDTVKYFQYGDSLNAISIQCLANGDLRVRIITSTSEGNQEVVVNPATFGIDLSKENIMVINFEALYVGTVKVQFQIDGEAVTVGLFDNANTTDFPYIATANLPVKVGMICGAGAGTPTMLFNCVSVQTVGGQEDTLGYPFNAYSGLITARNGTRTHLLSIQPRLLFNGLENRGKFVLESVDFIVNGNSPVFFELGIGQALTGYMWTNVNTTHSIMERSSGTISGSATMYFDGGLLASSASSKSSSNSRTVLRMPITLDDLGAQHLNGRLSVFGTGQGGTSACGAKFNWKEIY